MHPALLTPALPPALSLLPPTLSHGTALQVLTLHQEGLLDPDIAHHAGVSLATVKRYRKALELPGNCPKNQLGELGEGVFQQEALRRGFHVTRHPHGHPFDFTVQGLRVEVKTAQREPNGSFRFRLQQNRVSFQGIHRYPKDYGKDTDVLALVCMREAPAVYLLDSSRVQESIRVRPQDPTHPLNVHLEDWSIFT